MRIAGVARALPEHYYDQQTLLEGLLAHWTDAREREALARRLHRNVEVSGRHLALPMEEYPRLGDWAAANAAWTRVAVDLGERAVTAALAAAGFRPEDVGALLFTTVTGIATPSIDARLMNRLDLPADLRRIPMFGLGCVAGAAGVARAADYVRAYPDRVAVLLSVELCSLTLQRDDVSIPGLIASGLFGDGAAAVVVAGAERPAQGPEVVATRSVFYRDTEQVMGWDVTPNGLKIVLSADVPDIAREYLARDVRGFLGEHGLTTDDVAAWICHPGGPKVIAAMQRALDLPEDALHLTRTSLREIGNLSSASVLLVLEDTLAEGRPAPGDHAVMLAMGPGFCSELVLLRG